MWLRAWTLESNTSSFSDETGLNEITYVKRLAQGRVTYTHPFLPGFKKLALKPSSPLLPCRGYLMPRPISPGVSLNRYLKSNRMLNVGVCPEKSALTPQQSLKKTALWRQEPILGTCRCEDKYCFYIKCWAPSSPSVGMCLFLTQALQTDLQSHEHTHTMETTAFKTRAAIRFSIPQFWNNLQAKHLKGSLSHPCRRKNKSHRLV